MNRRLPPLNALRAFDAASRHLSFQKAAQELNVTPSALSFQIRQLEDFLQIALFERLNRRVVLTEAGARFAPFVQDGFERLSAAMAQLRPAAPDNILTVTTGPAFAAKWLAPRIHRFIEEYPDFELRIAASLSLTDLRKDPVDVAIRFGGGNYPGLRVETFAEDSATPLISPALVAERFGGNFTLDDLGSVTLLHDDSAAFLPNAVTWATWLKHAGVHTVDASRGTRFSHADHALEAAVDGGGIVLGRLTLAARDVRAGRLMAPFDLVMPSNASFHFCCLPEMADVPKVKALRDFVRDEINREQASIAQITAAR